MRHDLRPGLSADLVFLISPIMLTYHMHGGFSSVCPLYARTYKTLFLRGSYIQFDHFMPVPKKLYFSADLVFFDISIMPNYLTAIITIITVYRIYRYFTQKYPVCPLYARTYKTLFQRGPCFLKYLNYAQSGQTGHFLVK